MIRENILTCYKKLLLSVGIIFLLIFGWGSSLAQISDDVNVGGTVPSPTTQVTDGTLALSCTTHSDQTKWYSNNNPKCTWNKPDGVSGFSYKLDQISNTIPDNSSEGSGVSKTYLDVDDGIWYFHLKALGSSSITNSLHYKLNIDVTPPEYEYLRFREGDSTSDRTPTLEFEALDAMSGVDYYEYKLNQNTYEKVESPYEVRKLDPGNRSVEVRVYDKARNSNIGKTRIEIIALETPKITRLIRKLYLFQNVKIWGTGPTNSKIILYVHSENDKSKYEWETSTNSEGNWHYTYPDYLKPGQYEVYVRAYDEAGGESEKSNTESFLVSITGIYLFGFLIPIWAIIVGLVLLLTLLRFLIPYILILFPGERSRIIVVALLRQGELLLLEKNRELSTDELTLELPSGKLKVGETPEKATRRIIKEYLIGIDINKNIQKINFDLVDMKKPISLIISEHEIANLEVNKKTGYVTHRWINIAEDSQRYFSNITDGFQKQSFLELQKYLTKRPPRS